MKQTNTQTETMSRRTRFEFDPTRHYVLVQKPDTTWDGPQFDRLMDQMNPDGSDAYRIEADGGKSAEARRVTGHRQMVMLSCTQEHIDNLTRQAAAASHENAYALKPSSDFEEKLEHRNAISISDIPNAI